MGVVGRTAITLEMEVDGLATNSVKYGACFCFEGSLDVSSRTDSDIELIWAETGGPAI